MKIKNSLIFLDSRKMEMEIQIQMEIPPLSFAYFVKKNNFTPLSWL